KVRKNKTKNYNIIDYYNNLKKTLNYYNPFYGIKMDSFFDKIKNNVKKKNNFEKEVYLYRNYNNYKIPYKELSYIFNMSIEKIRIKKK
ncbi:hypothetical protein K5B08_00335, partial [Candidatus Carsonella ruddii]|nr:hypothetical protein [Candidatus Carsonella ruddii]